MPGKFVIGLINNDQPVGRVQNRAQLVIRQNAPGGVVRRADYRYVGIALSNGPSQQRGVVRQRSRQRDTGYFSVQDRRDLPIQRESRLGDQDTLAAANGYHQQRLNQLVRSVSGQ